MKKRLIKKQANAKVPEDFLWDWCMHNYVPDEEIDRVAAENVDCIYSGKGYRYLELRVDYNGKSKEELIELARGKIRDVYKYSSFAKSEKAVNYFVTTDERDFGVIISSEISGLDIQTLANKYKDEITQTSIFNYSNMEEEVVILEPVTSYEIVALVIEDEVEWL